MQTLCKAQDDMMVLYHQALLRKRNPQFFAHKDKSNMLMFEVAPVKKVSNLAVSPRFFQEWAALIDTSFLSDEVSALVDALRENLLAAEQEVELLTDIYFEAQAVIAQQKDISAATRKMMQTRMSLSKGALQALSHRAAQNVLDLVHILNLYPSVYKDSLTLLVFQLDKLPVKNAFVTEILNKIHTKIEIAEETVKPKRKIGF